MSDYTFVTNIHMKHHLENNDFEINDVK